MYVDKAAAVAEFKIRMTTKSLALKRGSASRSSGQWLDDDYDVLENGVVVGRIFFLDAVGPQGAHGCGRVATMATSNARHTAMSRHAKRRWLRSRSRGAGDYRNGSNGNELAQRFAAALACALAVLDCRGWRVRLEA